MVILKSTRCKQLCRSISNEILKSVKLTSTAANAFEHVDQFVKLLLVNFFNNKNILRTFVGQKFHFDN